MRGQVKIIGILFLLGLGLVRPVVFLLRPANTKEILTISWLTAASPLPLLFDRPAFYNQLSIVLHTTQGDRDGNLPGLLARHSWIAWSSVYTHFFGRIPPDGKPLNARDRLLAERLFCPAEIYGLSDSDFHSLTLVLKYDRQGEKITVPAEIHCPRT